MSQTNLNLPLEQRAIRAKCFHPSGEFVEFPREDVERSIPERFEKIAHTYPEQIAVKTDDQILTYNRLNKAANRLAWTIHNQTGTMGETVILLSQHNLKSIVGCLGILKAGKVLVVADTSLPEERIKFIFDDSSAESVVTDDHTLKIAEGLVNDTQQIINMDALPDEPLEDDLGLNIPSDAMAQILYTSGSTGRPKGIISNHQRFLHDVREEVNTCRLCSEDRIIYTRQLTFGAGVRVLFTALLSGAAIYAYDLKNKGLSKMTEFLIQERITVFRPGASVYRYFVNQLTGIVSFPDIRIVVMSGMALSPVDIQAFNRIFALRCLLLYHFSSSEAGLCSSIFFDNETSFHETVVPVGYPVEDKKLFLLDENGNEVEPGHVGEIAVQSRYLSSGYWHNTDLTNGRFRPDPSGKDERIHLTGDHGRMSSDGLLIHVGRKDFLVKIREYRVDIGEIENALLFHPQVVNAGVSVWDRWSGEKYLAAYVVPRQDPRPTIEELTQFLRQTLPEYMIPAAFMFLESLPIKNGKLDRSALPKPGRARPELTEPYVAPRTDVETELSELWDSVLGIDQIGVHDNFFDLGGHSLTAMRLVSQVIEHFDLEFSLQSLFHSPTIAEMATIISKLRSEEPSEFELSPSHKSEGLANRRIPRTETSSPRPLSFGQERLWLLNQLEPKSPVYNEPKLVRLTGSLDVSALEKSLNHIIMRHEVLRTTIASVDGRPVQRITVVNGIELPVIDLRTRNAQDRDAEARGLIDETIRHPFDLSRDLMLRVLLIRLEDQEHILLAITHHIASDAWSSQIFWQELTALYDAFTVGSSANLKEMPIQYADYAAWQREWLQGEKLEKQLSYWKKQLEGAPTVLTLPTDRPRPTVQSHRGKRQAIALSKELSEKLRAISRSEGVTPYMTLFAAFQVLLYRYTGQEDIVVGSPIANRTRSEVEGLIGFFVNTLVLRTKFCGNPSFRELLHQVRTTALEAYAHQHLPFEKLVEEFRPERNLNHSPLFQVMFNMNETADFKLDLSGLTTERLPFSGDESKFDLTLYSRDQGDTVHFNLVYRIDLFSESWARCFLQQYSCLLAQIVDAPEQWVGSYSLVTAEARELLPDPTAVIDDPPHQLATETFFCRAKENPAQIAISQAQHTWTYEQLAERASIIGRDLKAAGLKAADVVAVHGCRGFGLIASILGTFMSGGVLLLIDPQLPDRRKQLMLKEGRARKILFVGDENKDWVNAEQGIDSLSIESATGAIVDFDRIEDAKAVSLPKLSPNDPAYIFFTSGTTDIPKAVLGCHKGLSHFLDWQRETFVITPSDRVAQLTNLSFDPVLRDILLPLTSGATLCLPESTVEPATCDWLQRERISVLHTVPSLAETWLTSAVQSFSLPSLRWVFFAGEPLTDSLVLQWRLRFQSNAEMVNFYGPTETTLAKCFYRVPGDPRSGVQPLGSAMTGAQALILSHDRQLCGINEPGEIVLRTPFRSLGYFNAPEETRKRFVQNPFREDPDDLVYFTGDAGRYRPDGTLEILGRFDDQVKIRGVRVEPAEVTAILLQHPAVTSCVVVGRRNECGETCLVAYAVTSEPNSLTPGQLRSYLLDRLPSPMVPSTFVFLNVLPLTPNGKVDRKALPEPAYRKPEAENGFVAPRNRLEKTIADIWAEVLKIERIGVHDNFFEAGGHSLLAVRVLSRVMQALQLNLPLKILFEFPTVAHLAKVIEQKRAQMMAGDLEQLLRELETMPEKDAQQVLANESVCR